MVAIQLTPDHGFIGLAGSAITAVHIYQSILVGTYRKKSGIKYPQLYAEKAEMENNPDAMKFNCAQRAHGNTQEITPLLLFSLCFSGLFFPRTASSLAGATAFFRILYTQGYVTGDPKKRSRGGLGSFLYLGLHILSLYTGVQLVRGQL